MQSSISTEAPNAATVVRYEYDWSKTARDGFKVHVAWNRSADGLAVRGTVCDQRSGDTHDFTLELATMPPHKVTVVLVHQNDAGRSSFIDVTLTLVREGDLVSLKCNVPLAVNEFFYDSIHEWSLTPTPGPTPGPWPNPDPDGDEEIVIEAPADTTDLIPFIWMRPLSDAESADAALRFVKCGIPALQSLYANLDATQKVSTATAYINSSDFVTDITELGTTIALFPAARLKFMLPPGVISIPDLVSAAEEELAIPSLTDFLQSPAWTSAVPRVWSSIFALALLGPAGTTALSKPAVLSQQLLDILRIGQYLTLLTRPDYVLVEAAARQISLSAIVALPDNVALSPPSPTIAGADTASPLNTWEVIGVGKLKMARQHLAGYTSGELADVVNVMPRERQEMLERTVTTTSETSSKTKERANQSDTSRETSAASELADTIHEVMAADGMALNMSGVTPEYSNLNLVLTGSGANSQARSGWSSADTSRMVQRLTEQAAKRLGDRVSSQRGKEWQELRERRQSQSIDNTGNDRLVGVYRWVDRVVRVHVEELGSRLILAFVVEKPAQNWIAAVAAQGTMPLTQPAPLPAAYTAIEPTNYQALGAAYGLLALEAPPPAQVVISATVSRVTLGDLSLLCVPDGYAVTSAAVTMALSDSSFNLACSIGGYDIPASTLPSPAPTPPLSVSVPACTTTGTGPMVVNPPNQPTSVIGSVTLTTLPITTGCIPVTVMSAAPLFCVTVTLTCALVVPTDPTTTPAAQLAPQAATPPVSPLMSAWQMRIYERLQNAWQAAWKTYDAALLARIDQASAGHTGEVQRDTLKQACMSLIQQVSGTPGTNERLLEPLFDWAHMTWQYQSPTSAGGNNWPETHSGEATRPSSDRLFRRFLTAQTARVLLPANPAWESCLLFYLQFHHLWFGGPMGTPVTESTLPIVEEVNRPDAEAMDNCLEASPQSVPAPATSRLAPANWTVRVPTSMIYLQQGAALPQMYRHITPS